MSDRMAALRKHLSGAPSDTKWFQLVELFGSWPDDDELPLALDYAASHLDEWPDQMRSFYEPTPTHPCWPLARALTRALTPKELTKKKLPMLRHVLYATVGELKQTKALSGLTHLASLTLEFGEYRDLNGLEGLTNLASLQIGLEWESDYSYFVPPEWSCVEELTDLSPLATLTGLRSLSLAGFMNIESYEPINALPQLEELVLQGCHVDSIAVFSGLKRLKKLDLSYSSIVSLDGIEALTSLRDLNLFECPVLESFVPLRQLPKLKRIRVEGCRGVTSLDGLEHMAGARKLSLRRMDMLRDIGLLREFYQLKQLDLAYSRALKDPTPLRDLEALQELDLRSCTGLDVVPKRKLMRDRKEVEKFLSRL